MIRIISLLILFLLAGMAGGARASGTEKTAVLPGITNPYTITVSKELIYITEPVSFHIFSTWDFSPVKRVGKDGTGKGEFKGVISLQSGPGYILIEDRYKIAFFTPRGDLLRERTKPALPTGREYYIPLGDGFVVRDLINGYQASFFSRFFSTLLTETGAPSSAYYYTINRCDANPGIVKEIFTYKHPFFSGREINPTQIRGSLCRVYRDRLYIDDKDGVIHVFDAGGRPLYQIRPPYDRVKITGPHRRRYLKYWMDYLAGDYERHQGRLSFPAYFPPLRDFFAADDRIYILTYKEVRGKSELLILDLNGRLLKRMAVPLAKIDSLQPRVTRGYAINNRKLYRLVRNQERQYQLHITDLGEITK